MQARNFAALVGLSLTLATAAAHPAHAETVCAHAYVDDPASPVWPTAADWVEIAAYDGVGWEVVDWVQPDLDTGEWCSDIAGDDYYAFVSFYSPDGIHVYDSWEAGWLDSGIGDVWIRDLWIPL